MILDISPNQSRCPNLVFRQKLAKFNKIYLIDKNHSEKEKRKKMKKLFVFLDKEY